LDIVFSAEDSAFRDEVRAFLAAKLPDRLREGMAACPTVFVTPDIGQEWQAILHEAGWLAYRWPKEEGGTGWTAVQKYIFDRECALAGAPTLTALGLKLLAPVVYTFGTREQKDRILPRILSGADYWCQGFSEPNSGSDLASLRTRAVRSGDRYILNGTKTWTTHAHFANKIFCLFRTDPEAKPQAGISFLLVDMKQPGVTVSPIHTLAGDHDFNQVFFDGAIAPVEDRIGDEGQGWAIAKFLLENERGGSWNAPRLLFDLMRLERAAKAEPGLEGVVFDEPTWRRKFCRLRLAVQALDMIELRTLSDIAQSRPVGGQASVVKLLAANLRQRLDTLWLETFGDAGLELVPPGSFAGRNVPGPSRSLEAQLAAPRYLNGRAWTVFGGTNEVQANIIAKTILGL
jgi:alkylation response protein AidB-like acyl-CoA dehydrogenase